MLIFINIIMIINNHKMFKKIPLISIDNVALFLISVLPIGLLISTGVSELISIILVILFMIFTKEYYLCTKLCLVIIAKE